MDHHRRRARQQGFSLHEALVSLTILSSGLLTLAQFQGELHESSAEARVQSTAVNLAQQKLEELRVLALLDYAQVTGGNDEPALNPGDATRFQRTWVVDEHLSPRYKEVQVRMAWRTREDAAMTTQVSGVLAPSPMLSVPDLSTLALVDSASANPDDRVSDRTAADPEVAATAQAPRTDPAEQAEHEDQANQAERPQREALCVCEYQGASAAPAGQAVNPICSDACCTSAWLDSQASACPGAGCRFVARCPAS